MIIQIGGTAFGTKSGALIVNGKGLLQSIDSPAPFVAPQPGVEDQLGDVAMWGSNNLLPQEMAADIKGTGVLSAGIDAKARISIGRGPMPARIVGIDKDGHEELEFVADGEVIDYLDAHRAFENSFAVAKDLFGYGQAFIQIVLSRDRKSIVGFKRMDVSRCRFSRINPASGKSEHVYISADWQRWYSKEATAADKDNLHIEKIPLLDKDYPLQDLMQRTKGYTFMLAIQYPLTDNNYYSPSPWYCARKWVKIAQGIPELKAAMFKNQITLKYIIEIHPKFWELADPTYKQSDDKGKKAIQDRYYTAVDDYLTGADNAYKSIFSTMVTEMGANGPVVTPAIKVTSVDDKIKDGKFGPDSAAANSEILFALMINPALMGADSPGGPYSGGAGSGSNIREAMLVQVMLGEAERRMNSQLYQIIKHYNGWDKRIVFRYPNSLLTTLNTGANTQPVA